MPPSEGEGDGSDEGVAVGDDKEGGAGTNAAKLTRPTPPGKSASNGDVREVHQGGNLPPRLPFDPASIQSSATTADGISGVGSSLNLGGDERGKVEGVVSDGGPSGGGESAGYWGMPSAFGAYVEALGFGEGQGGNGGDVDGAREREEEEDAQEHQMKEMFKEQRPMPFELAMLEAMLQEVRGGINRNVLLACVYDSVARGSYE